MKILVTAGNTFVPIDRVRGITNIFTGRTGTQIASQARERGHEVTLLTSHPELGAEISGSDWSVEPFHTFDDLQELLERSLRTGAYAALIHSAAVSDYQAAGVYAPAGHTHFVTTDCHWQSKGARPPALVDRSAGKVKSDDAELWLRLVRTPKLIDRVRTDWNYHGILVKFKLEVGISDELLLEIAERARLGSAADLLVANTLEGAHAWAFLGPVGGHYGRVSRGELAPRLLDAVERLHRERGHG